MIVLWGGGDNVLESSWVGRFLLPRVRSCSVPSDTPFTLVLFGLYSPTLND